MEDTSAEARRRYFQLLTRRTPAERLAMCARLTRASREMALAGLRREHPEASEMDLKQLLAQRIYGDAAPRRLHHR